MRAPILALATLDFVTSGTDGHFKLSGLPARHYMLKACVNSATMTERAAALPDGSTLQMAIP